MAAAVPAELAANGVKKEAESLNNEQLESHMAEEARTAISASSNEKKWPGWPGYCVFRLIVPVLKVGSIIGRKGELVKKLCDETRARVRVMDAPAGTPERIVLISGQEVPEASLSPAMDALIRVFKRVVGLPESDPDVKVFEAGLGICSIRLVVASTQAISLIGKHGSLIKSIQEKSAATIRVLSADEAPLFASSDERVVEIQGEVIKVLKALEAVMGHLRKFLVDQSIIPLFMKPPMATPPASQAAIAPDYPLSIERESFLDREMQTLPSSGLSSYGQDHGFSGIRSSGIGRGDNPLVTQVTKTMQVPFIYAESIIGIGGANINYIRRTSNALLTVEESRVSRDEITIDIKGTPQQVQVAQDLIEDFINGSRKEQPFASGFGKMEGGSRGPESQLGLPSSYTARPSQSYGAYASSGFGGGYGSFRV